MTYTCISCKKEKSVTASVSKPRAVCVCEPCVRDSIDPDELQAKLNPTS